MPEYRASVVPLPRKVKVAVVIVNGSIASLKVAVTALLIATPVAALAGTGESHGGCGGVRGSHLW